MLKSTITLKNGVIVNVETDSSEQFMNILNGFGTNVAHTNVYASTNSERSTSPGHRYVSKGKSAWEDHEIVTVAEIIKNNIKLGNNEIVALVPNEIKANHGNTSVYTLTSRVHRYLEKGVKTGGITRNTVRVLRAHGYGYVPPKGKRHGMIGKTIRKWRPVDVASIGKIVRDNLDGKETINLVKKYLASVGETSRSNATVYTLTSDLRKYFKTGDKTVIGKRVLKTLVDHNLQPVTAQATESSVFTGMRKVIPVHEA